MLELQLEFAHIFKVAIDACETNVGNRVDLFETRHDELANRAGRAFALGRINNESLRFIYHALQLEGGDIAFLAGLHQSAENFLAIEFLTPPILLDDHVWDLVDALIRGEALVASLTFASPADGLGFLALARVYDAVLGKSTVGAFHRMIVILAAGFGATV